MYKVDLTNISTLMTLLSIQRFYLAQFGFITKSLATSTAS